MTGLETCIDMLGICCVLICSANLCVYTRVYEVVGMALLSCWLKYADTAVHDVFCIACAIYGHASLVDVVFVF